MRRFTYIELLITLVVLGVAMAPFMRMFLFGRSVQVITEEQVAANFLAVEKLEEIQSLPFNVIQPDFQIYAEMYKKFPDRKDFGQNPEAFYRDFSDLWTLVSAKTDERLFQEFLPLYKKYMRREYEIYPKTMDNFRRNTQVRTILDESSGVIRRKEVTVQVRERRNNNILAEIFLVVTE